MTMLIWKRNRTERRKGMSTGGSENGGRQQSRWPLAPPPQLHHHPLSPNPQFHH